MKSDVPSPSAVAASERVADPQQNKNQALRLLSPPILILGLLVLLRPYGLPLPSPLVLIVALLVIAWGLYRVIALVERWLVQAAARTAFAYDDLMVSFFTLTLRVIIPPLFASILLSRLVLPAAWSNKIPSIVLILSLAWLFYRASALLECFVLKKTKATNLDQRTIITRVQLLRRIGVFVVTIVLASIFLMLFDSVRALGTSLLASAGVAGVVLGLAAQRTFGNIFAGLQIALTQPIRIGDQINVENEFGTVEEITLTYVVVKLWDLRRLMLPVSYFIEQPFQNWTRTSTNVIGTVMLYVDFTAPVEALRKQLRKIVEASPHWNRNTCALHVSDCSDVFMQLRLIASAPTSAQSWELRTEIREKMLDYLRREFPQALPRARNEQKAVEDWRKAINQDTEEGVA